MAVKYGPALVATAGGLLIVAGITILFGAWGFVAAGVLLIAAAVESSW